MTPMTPKSVSSASSDSTDLEDDPDVAVVRGRLGERAALGLRVLPFEERR